MFDAMNNQCRWHDPENEISPRGDGGANDWRFDPAQNGEEIDQ